MKKENNKKSASALIGAAFLMATSAIGPGFLTQTGKFTDSLHGSFGFVILISVILAAIVQLNVWRVLCVSGMRGQDVANKVLPGLGYLIAFLVVAGGLVFNIGNVGGGALGFNTLLGIPTTVGYFIAGAIAILVFLMKNAMNAMDNLTKVLGGIMILVIFIVILIVQPPVGMAVKETVLPTASMSDIFPAILTLLGGTVGGYITFAGAHRLIDAGITGKEKLKEINKSSVMGMGIATIVPCSFRSCCSNSNITSSYTRSSKPNSRCIFTGSRTDRIPFLWTCDLMCSDHVNCWMRIHISIFP